jgi:hypothetical protein
MGLFLHHGIAAHTDDQSRIRIDACRCSLFRKGARERTGLRWSFAMLSAFLPLEEGFYSAVLPCGTESRMLGDAASGNQRGAEGKVWDDLRRSKAVSVRKQIAGPAVLGVVVCRRS